MAYILKLEKQVTAISMLAEGSSIRSTERVTGIHRDSIIRLMQRVGESCASFSNKTLRDLNCKRIEVDEIWGVGRRGFFLDNPTRSVLKCCKGQGPSLTT